jgi:molybdopterin converting factor small subunit
MPEVRVLGGLRARVGSARIEVRADGVRQLLGRLIEDRGPGLAAVFYAELDGSPDALHEDLRVLVNGRSIAFLDGVDTPLSESDTVTLHLAGARGIPGG